MLALLFRRRPSTIAPSPSAKNCKKSWRNASFTCRSATRRINDLLWFITSNLFYRCECMKKKKKRTETRTSRIAHSPSFHTWNMTYWRLSEKCSRTFQRIFLFPLVRLPAVSISLSLNFVMQRTKRAFNTHSMQWNAYEIRKYSMPENVWAQKKKWGKKWIA